MKMQQKKIDDIINYLKLTDRISTAGQPLADEIGLVSENGFQVVIFLALFENSELPQEKEMIENMGLIFEHIPVVFKNPQIPEFTCFIEIIKKHNDKKIFIHCEMNMRVSVFMSLYFMVIENLPYKDAMRLINKIWQPDEIWKKFMKDVMIEFNISEEKN
jgi:protein tyrosine phosphatase (PTP) superfamily phosphohydrolase (DUF442 family)